MYVAFFFKYICSSSKKYEGEKETKKKLWQQYSSYSVFVQLLQILCHWFGLHKLALMLLLLHVAFHTDVQQKLLVIVNSVNQSTRIWWTQKLLFLLFFSFLNEESLSHLIMIGMQAKICLFRVIFFSKIAIWFKLLYLSILFSMFNCWYMHEFRQLYFIALIGLYCAPWHVKRQLKRYQPINFTMQLCQMKTYCNSTKSSTAASLLCRLSYDETLNKNSLSVASLASLYTLWSNVFVSFVWAILRIKKKRVDVFILCNNLAWFKRNM